MVHKLAIGAALGFILAIILFEARAVAKEGMGMMLGLDSLGQSIVIIAILLVIVAAILAAREMEWI